MRGNIYDIFKGFYGRIPVVNMSPPCVENQNKES